MENNSSSGKFLPFIFGLLIIAGILIGASLNVPFLNHKTIFTTKTSNQFNKLNDVLNYVKQEYVDTIDQKHLVDATIEQMLEHLDPHSAYIPAEELQAVNEPLEGNFEGIGIEFHIQEDTIMVVSVIPGGPSEMAGLIPGDRIVEVDGKKIAGIKITNSDVMKNLRGQQGTKVKVKIYRRNAKDLLDYTIARGKIPIYSVDVSFMINKETGYIKVSRFAANTYEEYRAAFDKLKKSGMKNLVLDLRSNPGGYLDAATKLADEFLPDKKLIVYTEGKARPRTSYYSTQEGTFESGKLEILIDEQSASASEILAGALQDWDRATIIGRRSYGKGLVQEQTVFPDGSGMRLTIARYYTPTGRSIQKSYSDGLEAYNEDLNNRFKHGEFESADSVKFPDSLKYKTPGGKTVYGGGGIMPDVFVPLDTTTDSDLLRDIFRLGLLYQYVYNYVDENRQQLKSYKSFEEFNSSFRVDDEKLNRFISFAYKNGAKSDEKGLKKSGDLICNLLKANIARQLFQNSGYYPILLQEDNTFAKALELINKN